VAQKHLLVKDQPWHVAGRERVHARPERSIRPHQPVEQDRSDHVAIPSRITQEPRLNRPGGWDGFLVAYNEFWSDAGGAPLFNQTKHITPAQSRQAFGNRLATFDVYRKRFDPTDRLLNEYFRTVLSQ